MQTTQETARCAESWGELQCQVCCGKVSCDEEDSTRYPHGLRAEEGEEEGALGEECSEILNCRCSVFCSYF
eukprot:3143625-Rhodomonas_salina.1